MQPCSAIFWTIRDGSRWLATCWQDWDDMCAFEDITKLDDSSRRKCVIHRTSCVGVSSLCSIPLPLPLWLCYIETRNSKLRNFPNVMMIRARISGYLLPDSAASSWLRLRLKLKLKWCDADRFETCIIHSVSDGAFFSSILKVIQPHEPGLQHFQIGYEQQHWHLFAMTASIR